VTEGATVRLSTASGVALQVALVLLLLEILAWLFSIGGIFD
jgi:hypothetical protein